MEVAGHVVLNCVEEFDVFGGCRLCMNIECFFDAIDDTEIDLFEFDLSAFYA